MASTKPASPPRPAAARRGKQRDPELTRGEVLAAATEEFAEKGLHGARVDEIAARTAVSKHMIYYYFGSKDGLYSAVLERAYADFRAVEQVDYEALDPVGALATLVGNTFDVHLQHPNVIRIIMSENLDRGRHARGLDHAAQRELVISTVGRILARGAAAGLFRGDIDPLQIHMSISALSFYFVANAYTFGEVFGVNIADEDVVSRRRAEVIEVMLSRCLVR
ncbi:TetR family transcriptional regulator [Novosphingobium flavum]|uniref:TetR family transcriptional regulator n=1 Tax=Novosphingobium flavum TaxID=1778672 RepID=A0A7X1KMZ9_9SPHN|nr:TetR family transcriptional regulator [Novosphingobium flavum]MBC2666840.1 TetR family transcriptional regulator [Novosphingobium flavum]